MNGKLGLSYWHKLIITFVIFGIIILQTHSRDQHKQVTSLLRPSLFLCSFIINQRGVTYFCNIHTGIRPNLYQTPIKPIYMQPEQKP